jgi:predicted acetyltransferase
MDATIRQATSADWPAMARFDSRNFGFDYTEQDLEDALLITDLDRYLIAEDDSGIVGITGDYAFDMTVPGGASISAPGVTWVSVATTHRRRGILTALMAEQHRAYVDDGHHASVLMASESSIYGRFGYGSAIPMRRVEVDRRFARLRPGLAEHGTVRMVSPTEARPLVPDLHERWRRRTPGGLTRWEALWDFAFLDREHRREGASSKFYSIHPDGYVSYRVETRRNGGFHANLIRVVDLFAATDGAFVDLWRHLLSIDLAGPISVWDVPFGDPLPFLLDAPRQVKTLELRDGVWLRLLDVPAALAARRYQADGALVLDVHDAFLDRGGRFLLEGGPDGATCTATDREPDLSLGIDALGALYLGGHAPRTLAAAELVDEHTTDALRRATTMFAPERPPDFGTDF